MGEALSARARYIQRFTRLKTERSSWEKHWTDLSDFMLPRRARFTLSDTNRGDARNKKVRDGTPTYAARDTASAMSTALTSAARPWFRLATRDPALMEDGSVRAWLHLAEQRIREAFLRSNVYNALPMIYLDLVIFGTACLFVDEDEQDWLRCYVLPIGSYCLATSPRGVVDTLYREFRMTVRQVVDRWGKTEEGLARISRSTRDQYERKNFDEWVTVLHVVEPNPDADPDNVDSPALPWRSVYLEVNAEDSQELLSEKGYWERPVLAPRWRVDGEDVYGVAPGMDVLPDTKGLQLLQRRKSEAIDKLVNPPLKAGSELERRKVSLLPGDVTIVPDGSAGVGVEPIFQVQAQLQYLLEDIGDHQTRIREGLHSDLFKMLTLKSTGQRTAREVEELSQEKMLLLGPTLERLNDDLLDPLIKRVFGLLLRNGLLPPMPEQFRNTLPRVEFLNILSQAQKMTGTVAIERTWEFGVGLAKAKPEVLDVLDADSSLVEYADLVGMNPNHVRDLELVVDERRARAQQAAAMQAAEQAKPVAEAAKTISETDLNTGSGLGALLGTVMP